MTHDQRTGQRRGTARLLLAAFLATSAATVLAAAVGDEGFTMTSTSALETAPWRSFDSFTEAAEENAESRIHAGLHFRSAIDTGLDLGRQIGAQVMNTFLTPVN